MGKKLMFVECAPLISAVYARGAVTSDEKKQILDSLRNEPDNRKARAILARKLLECPDAPDMRILYEKVRE